MLEKNDKRFILRTDSYKCSHPFQFRNDAEFGESYFECRSDKVYKKASLALLQYATSMFTTRITMNMVEHAEKITQQHGEPFNRKGWEYIVNELDGKLPLSIKAVKEGVVVPVKNVLFTVSNTVAGFTWLIGWAEKILLQVWYGTTVLTRVNHIKDTIKHFYTKCNIPVEQAQFSFHNFGARGSACTEADNLGGWAHLMSGFMGTDNLEACDTLGDYYNVLAMPGYSIPATEHSTITSWGRENEMSFVMNYIDSYKFGSVLNPTGMFHTIACVGDSYNIYDFTENVTSGEFKEKIESDDYPVFVIRPDSGSPLIVIEKLLTIMKRNASFTIAEDSGLILFTKYRLIWGDGVTGDTIFKLMQLLIKLGYDPRNLAFGSGGHIMQDLNRDTLGIAIKACWIRYENGEEIDVFKDPIDDPGKTSKQGRQDLLHNEETDEYVTVKLGTEIPGFKSALHEVFRDGEQTLVYSFEETRNF